VIDSHHPVEPPQQAPEPPARPRMQFSLWALCATMGLLCVPFAIWGAMLRPDRLEPSPLLVLLCVISPLLLMIAISAIRRVTLWRVQRPRTKPWPDPDSKPQPTPPSNPWRTHEP
jgi:hypothetical protein